jgi:hypothetical protein
MSLFDDINYSGVLLERSLKLLTITIKKLMAHILLMISMKLYFLWFLVRYV